MLSLTIIPPLIKAIFTPWSTVYDNHAVSNKDLIDLQIYKWSKSIINQTSWILTYI